MTREVGRSERENLIYLLAYTMTLERVIKEYGTHNGDKEVLRRFRTAHTNIDKALRLWVATLSYKSQVKLANEAERYTAGLVPHKDAQKHTERMMKWENDSRAQALRDLGEGVEPVYELTELFFSNVCKRCNGRPNGKPHDECPAFKVFNRMDVPGWDDNQECKYAGVGVIE